MPVIQEETQMRNTLVIAGLLTAFVAMSPATAAEMGSCNDMFMKADKNSDGSVGGTEVSAFEGAYIKSGGHMNETTKIITKDQFLEACMKDAFKDMN
jgi:hypothetical protein